MAKPSEPPDPVDREVPTPRASGSFMLFHARALLLRGQLAASVPHTHSANLVHQALHTEVEALIGVCERWPTTASADVTERLAETTRVYDQLRSLEGQVRDFLTGGR